MSERTLAYRAAKGAVWTYGVFVSGRFFSLVSTAVLARLLIPEDFGVFALATLILGFIEVLRGLGFRDAVIYTSEKVEESADTAFFICLFIGLCQFVVVFLAAPLVAGHSDDARIVDVLRFLAVTFLFNAFAQIQHGMLARELAFHRIALAEFCALAVKAGLTVVLAIAGLSVWSLVVGHLVSAVVRTGLLWLVADWRPRKRFSFERARSLWRFGVHLVVQNIIAAFGSRFDQFVIGFLFGEGALGYYFIASRLPELVTSGFSQILTRVLFPAMVSVNEDRAALIEAFRTATKFTALVTCPAGLGLVVVAPETVTALFGGQWRAAVPIMQLLACLGVAATLSWAAGDLFKATGRPDINTRFISVETAISIPVIWLAAQLAGTTVAVVATVFILVLLSTLVRLVIVAVYLDLRLIEYCRIFRTPFAASAVMVGVVTAMRLPIADWPAGIILAVLISVGAASYVGAVWMIDRAAVNTVRTMAQALYRGTRAGAAKEYGS